MRPWIGRSGAPRLGRAVTLLLALYCFAVVASGFFHHDLACHLKSPTHCTTCVFSLSSAGVQAVGGVQPVILQKAGQSLRDLWIPRLATLVIRVNDRAPPA